METALDAGADVLFTEDLQDGQEIDGLRIVDPFRDAEATNETGKPETDDRG